jgi:hypothetical protein
MRLAGLVVVAAHERDAALSSAAAILDALNTASSRHRRR